MIRKLTQQEMNDWINSLNPVVIDFDKNGNANPEQVKEVVRRIKSEIDKIPPEA